MKHTKLTRRPLAQLNRGLHDRLVAIGMKACYIDFEIVDPIGDFVENPDLPICTLVVASHGDSVPMCLFNIPRGVNMKTWWHEEEEWIWEELSSGLLGSLVKLSEL